jgi:hypothetical protein
MLPAQHLYVTSMNVLKDGWASSEYASVPIEWPSVAFDRPADRGSYLSFFLKDATGDRVAIWERRHRFEGNVWVNCFDRPDLGELRVRGLGDVVGSLFADSQVNGVTFRSPTIMAPMKNGEYIMVSVTVPFQYDYVY